MGSTQSTWFSECFNLIKNDYFQQIHISESMGFYFSTDPTRLLLCRSGLHIIIQSPGLILHRHLVIFVYLNRLKGCLVDCRLVMLHIPSLPSDEGLHIPLLSCNSGLHTTIINFYETGVIFLSVQCLK